jgi:hypothetical protein
LKLQQQRVAIDTLYITEDGRQFVHAGDKRAAIDPQTGKLAWRAWQCNNPDCPGRKSNGDPLLFSKSDSLLFAKDGNVAVRHGNTAEDLPSQKSYGKIMCPACLQIRNLAAESSQQQRQYRTWCRKHVLPSAAKRIEELNQQRRALYRRKSNR